MLTVSIYSWDGNKNTKVGEIVWDGKKITATGSRAVHHLATEPLWMRGGVFIYPSDGERFVRSLWLQYKSAYFRATEAVAS